MNLDKFRALSLQEQKEILKKCAKIMENADLSITKQPKTPPSSPMIVKRELESPDTPYHEGSKKVNFLQHSYIEI
jgi:hypothetical protein